MGVVAIVGGAEESRAMTVTVDVADHMAVGRQDRRAINQARRCRLIDRWEKQRENPFLFVPDHEGGGLVGQRCVEMVEYPVTELARYQAAAQIRPAVADAAIRQIRRNGRGDRNVEFEPRTPNDKDDAVVSDGEAVSTSRGAHGVNGGRPASRRDRVTRCGRQDSG